MNRKGKSLLNTHYKKKKQRVYNKTKNEKKKEHPVLEEGEEGPRRGQYCKAWVHKITIAIPARLLKSLLKKY